MKYFFKNSFRYVRKYIPVQVFALLLGLARILILLATPQIVSLLVDRVVNPLLGEPPAQTASIFEFLIAGIPADDYVKIFWVLSSALLLFALLFVLAGIGGKIIGCGGAAKLCRFSVKDSLKIGVGMIARGEVALIVAQKGMDSGIIPPVYLSAVIVLVIVSSLLAPILLKVLFKTDKQLPLAA